MIQGDVIMQTDNFTHLPRAVGGAGARGAAASRRVELLRFPEVRTEPGRHASSSTRSIPTTAPKVFDFDWQDGGSDALFARARRRPAR